MLVVVGITNQTGYASPGSGARSRPPSRFPVCRTTATQWVVIGPLAGQGLMAIVTVSLRPFGIAIVTGTSSPAGAPDGICRFT